MSVRPGLALGLVVVISLSALLVSGGPNTRAAASGPVPRPSLTPHAAILIDGDGQFTAANGVVGGSGTASDPYVIAGWQLDASMFIGLSVMNTRAPFVVRNITVDNDGAFSMGIHLSNVSHARIQDSRFTGSLFGIQVSSGSGGVPEAAQDIAIVNNTFHVTSYDAITIAASNSIVSGNDIDVGFYVSSGTYGINAIGRNITLDDNRIVSVGHGLFVACTEGATVTRNVVTAVQMAIDLWHSGSVRVSGNDFLQGAAGEDVFVTGVMDCGSFVPSGANAWNAGYPAGGNFWIGYAGVDVCQGPTQSDCSGPDGFGDTPQPMLAGSVGSDRFPRMAPAEVPGLVFAYKLFGSATSGWGFAPAALANPGPSLVAILGFPVEVGLTSVDGVEHSWFLDANRDGLADAGDPTSPAYNASANLSFIAAEAGSFTYACGIHPASERGTFRILNATSHEEIPPAILHAPRASVPTAATWAVNATVTDASGVLLVLLHWRWSGAADFAGVTMDLTSPGRYATEVRIDNRTGTLEYYFTALDTLGNAARMPVQGTYNVTFTAVTSPPPPTSDNLLLVGLAAAGVACAVAAAVVLIILSRRSGGRPGNP